MKHRIWLEPCPPNGPDDTALPGGWFGPHDGTINAYIYGRHATRDTAYAFDPDHCVKVIRDMRDYGYPCRADPPITVRY